MLAVRRVPSLSVILLSFSLLALFSVNLYSLKLSKNAQVYYGDKVFKYFNSYPVDFNLISPRHMSRIGGHFVTSPHKKFQKSRVAYYSNCTASFNPVALSVVRSGDIHPHPGPHRQCNSRNPGPPLGKNTLKISSFNARSIVNKRLELQSHVALMNPDIIAITETWLHEGMFFEMTVEVGVAVYF